MVRVNLPTDAVAEAVGPNVRPLIVVGTGRCGSTLLHSILAQHRHVAYLTPVCVRWPASPGWNRTMLRAVSAVPPLQNARGFRRWLRPSEAYPLWEHHCPGFSRPTRDLRAADVAPACKTGIRNTLDRMLTKRRDRLVLKLTGWPRVGFLDAIFPRAKFVHIRRDGRAVAASWLNMPWWAGQGAPERWHYALSADQQERWQRTGRSPIALAALNWELLMDAFESARSSVPPEHYLDITYEHLCSQTTEVVQLVAEFGELPLNDRFRSSVDRLTVRNANDAWQRNLSESERRVLLDTIAPALDRHGYQPASTP